MVGTGSRGDRRARVRLRPRAADAQVCAGRLAAAATPSEAPSDVKPDMGAVRERLRSCYQAALNIDPYAAGRVVIHVEVAPDGSVVSTEPQYRSGNMSDALVACLARAFRPVRVEPPGAPTWFDAPVTFRKAN